MGQKKKSTEKKSLHFKLDFHSGLPTMHYFPDLSTKTTQKHDQSDWLMELGGCIATKLHHSHVLSKTMTQIRNLGEHNVEVVSLNHVQQYQWATASPGACECSVCVEVR